MPRYEYRCKTCDAEFELTRPMSESAEPAMCPSGHPGAMRRLSMFSSVGSRAAEGAPVPAAVGGPGGGCCGGGCGCG